MPTAQAGEPARHAPGAAARPPGGCEHERQSVYFTQEDPIGLAGGLNLYGYGDGDPVNNSDPFGLSSCAKDLADKEREECEKKEAAEKEAARATCRADLRQAAVALTLEVTGVKLFKFLKQHRNLMGTPMGQLSNATAREITAGVATHPAMGLAKLQSSLNGGTQYFDGQAAIAYAGAKMIPIPGFGSGLELGEALNSCLSKTP